ncbi:hypothetical protein BKA64DRAFT_96661 [Cadophora sp. MPI-SDFR-AT-0126]|nr:hypothetical protein BKA64DRAFT_96661 [Leotiomycetes sp. MPI-SDFR-AT-0126]
MGRPSSLAQSGLHESRDTARMRHVFEDILLSPNPALVCLAWCPIVWTTCLACHASGNPVQATDLFISHLTDFAVVVLIYSSFCTLNNVINGNSDKERPRSPSGMVLLFIIYLCRVLMATAAIYCRQGRDYLVLWLPCLILSTLCPLVKKFKSLGQFVLASAVVSVLLPAWRSSGGQVEWREDLVLLGLFTLFWIIYIGILHKAMDSTHSALAHTHYLSPSPATHLTLTLLSLLQVSTLSIYSYQSNKSPHFWILGVGVWVVNNVWHISDIRNVDWLWNEMSGRVAVQRNIWLGLWLCGAEICELWVGSGLIFGSVLGGIMK